MGWALALPSGTPDTWLLQAPLERGCSGRKWSELFHSDLFLTERQGKGRRDAQEVDSQLACPLLPCPTHPQPKQAGKQELLHPPPQPRLSSCLDSAPNLPGHLAKMANVTRELGPSGGGRREGKGSEDPSFSPQTTVLKAVEGLGGKAGWQNMSSPSSTQDSDERGASAGVPAAGFLAHHGRCVCSDAQLRPT